MDTFKTLGNLCHWFRLSLIIISKFAIFSFDTGTTFLFNIMTGFQNNVNRRHVFYEGKWKGMSPIFQAPCWVFYRYWWTNTQNNLLIERLWMGMRKRIRKKKEIQDLELYLCVRMWNIIKGERNYGFVKYVICWKEKSPETRKERRKEGRVRRERGRARG